MPPAERCAVWWAVGTAACLALAFAPTALMRLDLERVRAALPRAGANATGTQAAFGDPRAVLTMLTLHPDVRARRAAYEAALLRARGRRPAKGLDSLEAAAQATGADLRFLHLTAQAESGFDPFARARTSSARGLFQFIDQTWLLSLAKWGARHGRAAEAALIVVRTDGRAVVADPAQRRAILALRYDPELAARMAGELARENEGLMSRSLGRDASARELYAAHVFGVAGAVRLVRVAETEPRVPAAVLLPAAARANVRLFFRAGAPRSAGEVLLALP